MAASLTLVAGYRSLTSSSPWEHHAHMTRDNRQIWQAALGELQVLVNAGNYDTFLRDTRALGQAGPVFQVAAPNPFIREALQTRFHSLIRKTLSGILGEPVQVDFLVRADDRASASSDLGPGPPLSQAPPFPEFHVPTTPSPAPLERYTFDAFVVGDANRLAHAAALAVSDRPGQEYNPLFLYGGVGLGKTHLLRAIRTALSQRGLSALYVSSETFTNDLIEAIRQQRTDDFRTRYRRTHVLLIDDIQFIATRERTQEEFFHTFNDLHAAGGQIVLSSDRPPRAIAALEARLRSRFEWGLIADIQAPDLETRIAILRTKLNGRADSVPSPVLEFIARKAPNNIRELEGSLTRVFAYAQLHGTPISLDTAAAALGDLLADANYHTPTADGILQAICRYYGLSLPALRSQHRDRKHVVPRHLAMYLLREDARLSLPEIGGLLGGRDHTTVLHGCDKVRHDLDRSPQVAADLHAVRALLTTSA